MIDPGIADKPLSALTASEWEALCDGCAKCCLHKLQDEQSERVLYTRVHCRFLDASDCRCSDYPNRARLTPNCIDMRNVDPGALSWLPGTCAYRLRANAQPLPSWHYLVCGDREAVHRAGESIRGRSISEDHVHPDGYEEHIVHWVE